MKYLTVRQLQKLEGTVWAKNIYTHIDSPHVLMWHSLEQLASMLEAFLELEALYVVAATAMEVLRGGQSYFIELGVPRPYALERLLLQVDRLNAHMDPDA